MERISLTDSNIEEAAQKAAEVLRAGGVVLYPTDTIYGLGVDSTNESAMKKLFAIKGREEGKAVSSVLPDIDAAAPYARVTPLAQKLADEYLPGKLTIVLSRIGGGDFSVRVPQNAFCLTLADVFGKPYTATSANKSGEPTCATVDEILAQLGDAAHEIDLVVDEGKIEGQGSTVVDARGSEPVILRQGAVDIRLTQ